jgi:cytochrome c5
MDAFNWMNRNLMFYLKPIFISKLLILGLMLSVLVPLISCAAVKDNQTTEKQDIDTAMTPVKDSKSKHDEQENLANEPASRGKLLYENHCHSCHESLVHIRGAHKAKTYEDIQYWVGRWALETDLKWSADEIDAVVQHLNRTFYHY